MAKYISKILQEGLVATDLAAVTTIGSADLAEQIAKFNYAAEALRKKTGTQNTTSYINNLDIRNTDQLAAKLNAVVRFPLLPLPLNPLPNKAMCEGPALLMHLVNYMWLQWTEAVPANLIKHYSLMEDPAVDGGPTGQMLSMTKHGFKTLGICFRGDTRSYAEFGPEGFAARYSLPPGHSHHIPGAYGTVVSRGMCFDKVGKDFLNQSGICVARNILGSMKFVGSRQAEDPTQVLSRKGHMFALQFDTGVDTERMQLDKVLATNTKTVLWRAGEKAAYKIPKKNFVASCEFEVDNPYHTDVNPVFQFRRLSHWTFHNATPSAKAYCINAISNMEMGKWYHFTRQHDWAAEA